MKKRRGVVYFLCTIFLIFSTWVVCSAPIVSSFDTKVAHPNIASLAAKLYNESGQKKLTNEEIQWIVQGAEEEDMPTRWFNHFYDPVHDKGMWFGRQFLSAPAWSSNSYEQSNFSLGDQSWKRALYNFQKGKKKEAFIALGHTLHLIADMAVPAHTRLDPHPSGDSFEQYVKNNWSLLEKQIDGKAKVKKVYNLPAVFDVLAGYSNGYFYSDDSVFDSNYNNPNFNHLTSRVEKINGKNYKFMFANNFLNNKLCRDKSIGGWQNNFSNISAVDKCVVDDQFILSSYATLLLPQAIGYSAGVIQLFLTETTGKTISATDLSGLQKSGLGFANEILGSAVTWGIDTIESAQGEGVDVLNPGLPTKSPTQPALSVVLPKKTTAPILINQPVVPVLTPKPTASYSSPVPSTPATTSPVSPGSATSTYYSGGGGSSNSQPVLVSNPNLNLTTAPISVTTTSFQQDVVPTTTPETIITTTSTQNSTTSTLTSASSASTTLTSTSTSTSEAEIPTTSDTIIIITPDSIPTTTPEYISEPAPDIASTSTIETPSTTPDVITPTSTPETSTSTFDSAPTPTTTPDILLDVTPNSIPDTIIPIPTSSTQISPPETSTTTPTSTSTLTTTTDFFGPGTGEVIINEIAWAGTSAEWNKDEWIEFYNNTDTDITLASNGANPRWKLMVGDQEVEPDKISDPVIPAHGYYIMERGFDDTIKNVSANTTYASASGFNNSGARLRLLKPDGVLSDEVDCSTGWFAGDNTQYHTMERLDPTKSGNDPTNWQTNRGPRSDPRTRSGGQIFGSPKTANFGNIALNTTQLAGTVVTLTKEDSPYVLGGYDVKVGAVLNIEPGVVIKSNYAGAAMIVEGALNIRGTSDEPIRFTSGRDLGDGVAVDTKLPAGEPVMGDWQGLWFWPGSVGNIDYLEMQYAGHKYFPRHDLYATAKSEGIRSDSASVTINNSIFLNDGEVFVRSVDNSNLSISNSIFEYGNTAIYHSGFATPILVDNEYLDFTEPDPVVVIVVK